MSPELEGIMSIIDSGAGVIALAMVVRIDRRVRQLAKELLGVKRQVRAKTNATPHGGVQIQ